MAFLFVIIGPASPELYLGLRPEPLPQLPQPEPPRPLFGDATRPCMWSEPRAAPLLLRACAAVAGPVDGAAARGIGHLVATTCDVCVCPGGVRVAEAVLRLRDLGLADVEQQRRVGVALRDVAIFESAIACPREAGGVTT
jgi:hypothetical protein